MNIDHLKDKFDLNELEVSLLEYIKKNQKQLKNITIRQMAKDNFTSTSAIYRLCNKLEFSGYSDMIIIYLATLIIMLLLKNTKTIYLILFNY